MEAMIVVTTVTFITIAAALWMNRKPIVVHAEDEAKRQLADAKRHIESAEKLLWKN